MRMQKPRPPKDQTKEEAPPPGPRPGRSYEDMGDEGVEGVSERQLRDTIWSLDWARQRERWRQLLSAALKARSALAAKKKSLSVNPLILCVQISTLHLPHAMERSG